MEFDQRLEGMNQLIFATGNDHKIEEALHVLKDNPLDFKSMSQMGFKGDIIEDGDSLEANALIKARHIFNLYNENVFSEDTGLEIYGLDMEPGVYTARYAGPQKNHADNMDLVLDKMKGMKDRRARFRAVIALIWNQKEYIFEGKIEGRIAENKFGEKGFGYDPIFIPETYDKSFAELGKEVKSTLSHRARAIQSMKRFLDRL